MSKHAMVIAAALSAALAGSSAFSQVTVTGTTGPPPLIAESQPPSPGAGYVWIGGNWTWSGRAFTWSAGRWEQPPAQAQTWEPPQWETQGRTHRLRPGRWRGANNNTVQSNTVNLQVRHPLGGTAAAAIAAPVLTVSVAPPDALQETRPPSPDADSLWVGGFWQWNNRQFTWTAGRWESKPVDAEAWEAPQWERAGPGYRFRPGRWRPRPVGQQPAQNIAPDPGASVHGAPPRARAERRPRASQRGQVWVAGWWAWDGAQYRWSPGQWQDPPTPRARWTAPQWRRQGQNWVVRPGRWR